MEKAKKHIGLIILIVLGLIPLVPLLHSGFPITHDGQDHIARIANFYKSLSEGNVVPRWAADLNWGYGHPILMFLYPFPSYLASLFHLIGFSLIDSVKIVFGLTFVLSGITMYLWMRNVLGEKAGIVAGVLYMYAPYRFVDLYVRGAIGEHVAFLFIPLVLYFLLKLSKRNSYIFLVGGSLSVGALLLSHNAVAIMSLPFAALYALILLFYSKRKVTLAATYASMLFLGFGISSFFLLPAFFEGKYTLRDIVTGNGEYKNGFVSVADFFALSWSFGGSAALSKQIGLVQIGGILLATVSGIIYKFTKQRLLFVLSFASLIMSLFLMLSASDFIWQHISLIQKFQFPWRLLSVVVLASAILSAFPLVYIQSKKYASLYVVAICLLAVALYLPYYKTNGYLAHPENFYTTTYKSTTDTGESSPIWSVRFMEHTASASSELIDGQGVITQTFRSTTRHDYVVTAKSKKVRVRENTLYFPGWEVLVNGSPTSIEFQDRSNRGLITYYVPQGKNVVSVQFHDTKLRRLADIVSCVSLLLLAAITVWGIIKSKPRSKKK